MQEAQGKWSLLQVDDSALAELVEMGFKPALVRALQFEALLVSLPKLSCRRWPFFLWLGSDEGQSGLCLNTFTMTRFLW